MESIFESLENLNVSEECFNEIMGIVEEIISERNDRELLNRKKRRSKEYFSKLPSDNPSYEEVEKAHKALVDAERKVDNRGMRREALGGRKLEKEMSKTEGRFSRNFKNAELASNHRAHVLSQKTKEHPENISKVARQADKSGEEYGEQTLTKELNGKKALRPSKTFIDVIHKESEK